MRGRALLLALVGTLLALGLAEIGCRLVLRPPGFQPWADAHVPGLRIPHPIRGFAHMPNFSGRRRTKDYDHAIVTNELGLRDAPLDHGFTGLRILAVGDSFTEGMGVEQEQSWPEQLQHNLPGIDVVNAGIVAYSLRQMRQTAEELIPIVRPQLLIAGVYLPGSSRLVDPYVLFNGDTVRQSMVPRLRPAPGGYQYSAFDRPWAVRTDLWITPRVWFLGHLLHQAQRLRGGQIDAENLPLVTNAGPSFDLLVLEINRLQDVAGSVGIPLVIVLVNGQERDGRFAEAAVQANARLMAHARHREIVVVNPLSALQRMAAGQPTMRFPSDGHWSARAHEIVAAEVTRALSAAGSR